jgi:hypothetical protein
MNWLSTLNGGSLYAEIRQRSLRILYGGENLVIPIERQPTGRLTDASKHAATQALRTLLKKKNWQPRARVFCAIEARGVSLRRLSLPASANGDLERVLRLQIESEFPLPPESLAWGYSRIETEKRAALQRGAVAKSNGKNDYVVVALKKELLDDYTSLFVDAGITPVFTIAALARSQVSPKASKSYAVLDIGRSQSELISFTDGNPDSLRVLSWGGETITRAIEQKLSVSAEQAESLKLQCQDSMPNGEVGQKLHETIRDSLVILAKSLTANWSGEILYLTGRGSRYPEMSERLAELIPGLLRCERLEGTEEGPTTAILGLKDSAESDTPLPIVLRRRNGRGGDLRAGSSQGAFNWLAVAKAEIREIAAQPALMKWARLAILLAVCIIVFPYAQAFLLKPFLAKKLARIRAESGRLAVIDRELTFLQYLKNAQPPYLDALTVLANAAPPGTRFDSLSINRRGELALKGNIGNAQQVVDFRTKLIKSAYFSSVTVEEQTPSPDRQRMTVRILAQCRPAGARPPVKVEPLPPGFTPGGPAMPFPGMMPGGPVAVFPGAGMPPPGAMIPPPPGAVIRGPEGDSRAATRAFQSRYGLPEGLNPGEAPKPAVEETPKPAQ